MMGRLLYWLYILLYNSFSVFSCFSPDQSVILSPKGPQPWQSGISAEPTLLLDVIRRSESFVIVLIERPLAEQTTYFTYLTIMIKNKCANRKSSMSAVRIWLSCMFLSYVSIIMVHVYNVTWHHKRWILSQMVLEVLNDSLSLWIQSEECVLRNPSTVSSDQGDHEKDTW